MLRVLAVVSVAWLTGCAPSTVPAASRAEVVMEAPPNWNGTVLLYSRGYSPRLGAPSSAPVSAREALLAQGYALASSDYGAAGWALEEAVPAQVEVVRRFSARFGKPKRVIAWGESMGGLVTTALVENHASVIDGGVALCASIGGALGMMNMGLDGAFAFRTLLDPQGAIELVRVKDDRTNSAAADQVLRAAMSTPEGRARVLLAGVLAGLPHWTRPDRPEPRDDDADAIVEEMSASFVMGVFMPRVDQERRAGGVFSWNQGVDYERQLERSGRRALVEALYRKAGLDLEADLRILARAPRITADPRAVAYMRAHYTPTAKPKAPLVSMQKLGDGLTSPSLQRGYEDAAPDRMFDSLWLDEAGHCRFTATQTLAAIQHLEARLEKGAWPARPAGFSARSPAPMLRPCVAGGRCT